MSQATDTNPISGENPVLNALDERRSVPASQLCEPGPGHDVLMRMLRSAVRVPDHGKRVPFRFVRIEGDAREALGASATRPRARR